MKTRSKLLLAALAATFLLALGAGTATANRSFEVGGGARNISATANELRFSGSNGLVVSCLVTLNGSIHARIAKVRGTLVGYITEGRTERCHNSLGILPNTAEPLFEAPWHITYETFSGTLPRIVEVLIVVNRPKFLIRIENLSCLFRAETIGTGGTGTTGAAELSVESLTPLRNEETLVTETGGEIFRRCPPRGELGGPFRIATSIVLRLV